MHHQQSTLEVSIIFECQGQQLVGIIHNPLSTATIGVLVVVGGPQYRVGSHRQFVLLARYLAAQGIPVMRFDVRGMGDSEGEPRSFADLDDDIAAAVDCLFASCPGLKGVVLWGLCDAASASLFYGYQDNRVRGLVLLNPWVFTEQGAAKTYIKHYYFQRLVSRDFWLKVFSLRFDYAQSLSSLLDLLRKARRKIDNKASESHIGITKVDDNLALPIRMRECLQRFGHPVLLILSGRDLTAQEFKDVTNNDSQLQFLLNQSRVTRCDLPDADHTFSSSVWRECVARWTSDWINTLDQP